MKSYLKQPPGRSEEYLEYIRGLPCCVCGEPTEPHHLLTGGVALKGSDFGCVPLCRYHHGRLHESTLREFNSRHNFSLVEIGLTLLTKWADRNWSD